MYHNNTNIYNHNTLSIIYSIKSIIMTLIYFTILTQNLKKFVRQSLTHLKVPQSDKPMKRRLVTTPRERYGVFFINLFVLKMSCIIRKQISLDIRCLTADFFGNWRTTLYVFQPSHVSERVKNCLQLSQIIPNFAYA